MGISYGLAMLLVFLALLLFTLVVALMSLFLPGRDDEMLRNNPALYLDVQSWFMLG